MSKSQCTDQSLTLAGPLGETTPCYRDQNKIYYFCPEILPSLHFGQAEGNLTSAISLHFIGIILPTARTLICLTSALSIKALKEDKKNKQKWVPQFIEALVISVASSGKNNLSEQTQKGLFGLTHYMVYFRAL